MDNKNNNFTTKRSNTTDNKRGERRDSNRSSENKGQGGYRGRSEGQSQGGYRGRSEGQGQGGYRGRSEGQSQGGYRGRSEGQSQGGYRGRSEGQSQGGYSKRSEGQGQGGYRGRSEGQGQGGYRGRSEGQSQGGYRDRKFNDNQRASNNFESKGGAQRDNDRFHEDGKRIKTTRESYAEVDKINTVGYEDISSPIVVLDSGMGGVIVERKLRERYPAENFLLFIDNDFMPYGTKKEILLQRRVTKIIKAIKDLKPKALVLACNTIDSLTYDRIITQMPTVPVVSIINPTAKAAVEASKTNEIAVLATVNTIASQRYIMSAGLLKPNLKMYGIECENLAKSIETGIDIQKVFAEESQPLDEINFDTLILGCTHYARIRPLLLKKYPGVNIIDSTDCVVDEFEKYENRILMQKLHKTGSTRIVLTKNEDVFYLKKLYNSSTSIEVVLVK